MMKPINLHLLKIGLSLLILILLGQGTLHLYGCGAGSHESTPQIRPSKTRPVTRPASKRMYLDALEASADSSSSTRPSPPPPPSPKKGTPPAPSTPAPRPQSSPAPRPQTRQVAPDDRADLGRIATAKTQGKKEKVKQLEQTAERKKKDALAQNEAQPTVNREEYAHLEENHFKSPLSDPFSTFSIDVDTAGYSNLRRLLRSARSVPRGAVRIEEMINYFHYDYLPPAQEDRHPFKVHTELSRAPWNTKHALLKIGIKGFEMPAEALPPSNLVFLVDVSGSMNSPVKLPLVKESLRLLVNRLRKQDRVSIVTYSGKTEVALEPISGYHKADILEVIDRLHAGGGTAGGAGLKLAYEMAREGFIEGGNNRILLATDGDFNLGISSESELVEMMEEERKSGVFLSLLGYGVGNYQDRKMSSIAQRGNGNYAYIDSLLEAQKVLVSEMSGTLLTIAKDVKIQLEFNPNQVASYRLIGYENRMLNTEDFNDDRKDAGELGAGHTVTALYEIVPVGVDSEVTPQVTPSKYTQPVIDTHAEWLTLRLRYKTPKNERHDLEKSELLTYVVEGQPRAFSKASKHFKFASAVAAFGQILTRSKYQKTLSLDEIHDLAQSAKGDDPFGYREEFLELVSRAKRLY